jgi:hypothetical protein
VFISRQLLSPEHDLVGAHQRLFNAVYSPWDLEEVKSCGWGKGEGGQSVALAPGILPLLAVALGWCYVVPDCAPAWAWSRHGQGQVNARLVERGHARGMLRNRVLK